MMSVLRMHCGGAPARIRSVLLCLGLLSALISSEVAAQNVVWSDGAVAPRPRGVLLTNNPNYWGEMTRTAVTYSYPEQPTNPPDTIGNDKTTFGNRLLEGRLAGNWYVPVGMNRKPLVVDFDFHEPITLTGVAAAQYLGGGLRLAEVFVRNSPDEEWRKVYSKDSPGALHRMVLAAPTKAQYVRVLMRANGNITYISEMWIWGEARGIAPLPPLHGFLPGMERYKGARPGNGTILSVESLKKWRDRSGYRGVEMTWAVANPWQMLDKDPLTKDFLPGSEGVGKTVTITTTRAEGESAAVYLINPLNQSREATVTLSPFVDSQGRTAAAIEARLYTAGSVWTRRLGEIFRPLFSETNKLRPEQMEMFLTNGTVIKDFPTLHLPPLGAALVWITVQTRDAAPGIYTATLSDGHNQIPVRVEVRPVTLPRPDVWVRFWESLLVCKNNLWADAKSIQEEIAYQIDLGMTVQEGGWPDENPITAEAMRQMRQRYGRPGYLITHAPPGKTPKERIDAATQHAVRLKMPYDEWAIELFDEPQPNKNMERWVEAARQFKEANPKINIYINPLFWIDGKGFADDQMQVDSLKGWYNDLVDISVPILGQTNAKRFPMVNEEYYNHLPRLVRAYYIHPCPGRMLTWDAFVRGYNGWGFYAYYAPRGNAWNDFDGNPFDYQIVYPGPAGFVPTIESESIRESWDDFCLLTLLKQQNQTEEIEKILAAYDTGIIELPADESPMDRTELTRKAIRLLPGLRAKMMALIHPTQ